MDIIIQKELMNKMLDYLERNTFTIKWNNGSGTDVQLIYNKNTSIMRKTICTYDYQGNIRFQSDKEKAFGGSNAKDMFHSILKAAKEKAKKKVLKWAIKKEFEENDIFLGD